MTDLTRALGTHDRTQMIMACGAGKTLVGRWYAEASSSSLTLVVVPSLSLLAQTLAEWRRGGLWPFEALVVCSDPSTADGVAERADGATIDDRTWETARAQVTTDVADVRRFLTRDTDRNKVVFSTYHSVPVAAAGARAAGATYTLTICDEAHRLAGAPADNFQVALDDRLPSHKRLFMTATPLSFDDEQLISMNDPSRFGPVAHTVSFAEAIDAGLLCDYQLLAVAEPGDDQTPVAVAAVVDAARRGVTRLLSYHGRVRKAEAFARSIDGRVAGDGRTIRARWVGSTMSSQRRAETLAWLGEDQDREVRVVANARCLTEGVDVPNVDAVLFADPRDSVVDVMQAVGRALRAAPGKERGYVIVPVTLSATYGDDTDLALSSFACVWTVIRALRAHDERLAAQLDVARRSAATGTTRVRTHVDHIDFTVPAGVDLEALLLRTVEETTHTWEAFYALALDYGFHTGGKTMPRNWKARTGEGVGEWAERQRAAHRRGTLAAGYATRLEQIPGWAWNRAQAVWDTSFALLETHAAVWGTVADSPAGDSVFAGVYDAERRPMGRWIARQRQAWRDGTLAQDRAERLAALPGWDWQPFDDETCAHLEALRCFAEFEKHLYVPDSHVEDDLALGKWLWRIRRARHTGTLNPAVADEIAVIAPRDTKGAEKIDWKADETAWRLAFTALRAFQRREGHLRVPSGWREDLGDAEIRLSTWIAGQRHRRRRGDLDPVYENLLGQVPGWVWEVEADAAAAPLELKDGVEHGTTTAINAGCKCEPCAQLRRTTLRNWARNRRSAAGGVAPDRVRAHLAVLTGQVADRAGELGWDRAPGLDAIALAADVAAGTVRSIMRGSERLIHAEQEQRLCAVTVADVFDQYDAVGSRGRPVISKLRKIPAGPTLALLEELRESGWPDVWLAEELGYSGRRVQIHGETVSVWAADRVAALHARLRGRVAPTVPRNRRMPSLAAIEAGQAAVPATAGSR